MNKDEAIKGTIECLLSRKGTATRDSEICEFLAKKLKIKSENEMLGLPNAGICYTPPRLSESDTMLVNEAIWDLIIQRIITPGTNRDNTHFPWLRITDETKAKELIG
jgi:hypothetical protein